MDNFHKLIEGFHNFKQTYFLKERQYFESLEKAQNPKTLVVACCDSRVDPAILLHCKPGDLFVIRNVAAQFVPRCLTQASNPCSVMSAIEYGVKHLNVEHIVVMGHLIAASTDSWLLKPLPEKLIFKTGLALPLRLWNASKLLRAMKMKRLEAATVKKAPC